MPLLSNARNAPKGQALSFHDLYEGIGLLRLTMSADEKPCPIDVQPEHIHLFFSMEGDVAFQFGPMYMRPLPQGQSFFIFNPKEALRAQASMPKGHRMVGIRLAFSRMHTLFMRDGQDAQELPFLNQKDLQRPIYDQRSVDAAMQILLEGLFHERLSPNAQRVAHLGQILELLGLYFHTSEPNVVACPFLKDEETVRKIREAKSIILDRWQSPPTIAQLSVETGLNPYRLKAGFKEVYGNTVYGFVMDTRLNHARRMLDAGGKSVNEVAFDIGYTNPSHFIAAFKKKFGTTPRKYKVAD
ncbi:AraC family transcriptional regulator [Schleiferiaceae bacterium]|jgi:AraC-like DNA-binding protein|nr:AraC family transcriptional regulator [Schleiferiaceae bacterium]